jgi:hypothetical protein
MGLRNGENPLPQEFLEWQVALRRWTVEARRGAPHAGVVPLVLVSQSSVTPGTSAHSVVCGLLPRADKLADKTKEFRELYEGAIESGARAVYDRGLAYLDGYYRSVDDFDPSSITTLLPEDSALVRALRADPRCALVFHVFDIGTEAPGGAMRCQQLACRAEVLDAGPVFDNVWWHNALFHGFADGHVVIRFGHQRSYDVRFGRLEPIMA